MGGVRKTGSFAKLKVGVMKNFVKRCATVYGGWLLAIGCWLMANGQKLMANSQRKKPTHPPGG